jgi:hypothetical protein
MTDNHVQHTWHLTNPDGDDISIDLWTDDYTVHVDGGPGETSTTCWRSTRRPATGWCGTTR